MVVVFVDEVVGYGVWIGVEVFVVVLYGKVGGDVMEL